MSKTAVAIDIDEAADIALDFSSKVAFHLVVAVQDLSKMSDLLLGQVSDFLRRVDARLLNDLVNVVLAHSVKERQSVNNRFISGKVDACNTCHKFRLSLFLLVFAFA